MFTTKQVYRSDRGNIGVLTALLALPITIATTLAIDHQSTFKKTTNIQDALDSAALSTVLKGADISSSNRKKHAIKVFDENYSGDIPLDITVSSTAERVTVSAHGHFETTAGKIIGLGDIPVAREATAVLVKGSTTCLLVLDPKSKKSLMFEDDTIFNSPNCAVQVNSKHPQALWSASNTPPNAGDFCVSGGYKGNFATHVNTECSPVTDPYKDKKLPKPEACLDVPAVTRETLVKAGEFLKADILVKNQTPRNKFTHLFPGNYCGGLYLEGDVNLNPGVYHITDGSLVFGETSNIRGNDITFILSGRSNRLHMKEGAKADITASKEGELGGVAFYQVQNRSVNLPETRSLVQSGGNLSVNGVFYFPTQQLLVEGNAQVGAKAKATAFIAYQLRIKANVRTTIEVDHTAAGIPAIYPRTDEGARLILNAGASL